MSNFHQTRMGQIFFEQTLPQIERHLQRIADALEENNKKNIKLREPPPNNIMKFKDHNK
jgi:hypothetical protein